MRGKECVRERDIDRERASESEREIQRDEVKERRTE